MNEAFYWFIGGAVLLGMVLAYFTWAEMVLSDDADAPAHVANRDWDRVKERRR